MSQANGNNANDVPQKTRYATMAELDKQAKSWASMTPPELAIAAKKYAEEMRPTFVAWGLTPAQVEIGVMGEEALPYFDAHIARVGTILLLSRS